MRRISDGKVSVLPSGKVPLRRLLEGNLVVLEPLHPEAHSEDLYRVSHEDEEAEAVWNFLPEGPFTDLASFEQWARRMARDTDRVFYALRDKHTKRLGGMASYLDIRPAMGSMEIGYIWFAPFLQRTRQATEALFLMLRYAFDELGYRRTQWRCNALNERSRSAASRLGFTYEGVFYQHMVVKGHNRDTAWYSMLDYEWPHIRANFEHWLAASNFDAQGHQLSSLGRMNENAR